MQKKKLISIALAVLLVVGGGVGGYFYYSNTKTVTASESKPELVLDITEKDGLTMNLKDRGYIKVNLAVGYTDEKKVEDLTKKKAVIIDKVITFFGQQDLESASDKTAIQQKLTDDLKVVVPEVGMTQVYFTQYVMQ